MKIIKLNSKLTIPLILIVLSIWAIVIYNIIGYINSTDKDDNTGETLKHNLPVSAGRNNYRTVDIDTLSYNSLSKSPFVLGGIINDELHPVKPVINVPKVKESPPPPKLDYKIAGVIISGDDKLAVLEDITNGKTLFLREGDSYLQLHIKLIETEKVSLLEDKTPKEIVVPR